MSKPVVPEYLKNHFKNHTIAKDLNEFQYLCSCSDTVETPWDKPLGSVNTTHQILKAWSELDLPLVKSVEELASLPPETIIINEQGDALAPRTENPRPDNDEVIFTTRGPFKILL